ncbi:MAG: OmpA family protein, partial [Myxococcota bacterium]
IDTDSTGKYHLQAVDPGNHMVKLDTQSLPPGSKMIDTPERIFYISRGLFRKINYAVRCKTVTATIQRLLLKQKAKPKSKRRPLSITGNIYGPRISINGVPQLLPIVHLAMVPKGQRPNFKRTQGFDLSARNGALLHPIAFHTRLAPQTRPAQWRIDIYKKANSKASSKKMRLLVHTLRGVGTPPAHIRWNGKNTRRRFVLRSGNLYVAQLTLTTIDRIQSQSRPVLFGINALRAPPRTLFRKRFSARWMGKRGVRVRGRLKRALRRPSLIAPLKRALQKPNTRIEVHVHHHNKLSRQRAIFLTVRRASSIAQFLQRRLRIPEERIIPRGFGSSKPRLPNISRRNRNKNLRIYIMVTQQRTAQKALPILRYKALVQLGQRTLKIDTRGNFRTTLKPPYPKSIRLHILGPQGKTLRVPLKKKRRKPNTNTKRKGRLYRRYARRKRRSPNTARSIRFEQLSPLQRMLEDRLPQKTTLLHPSILLKPKESVFTFQENPIHALNLKDIPTFRLRLAQTKATIPTQTPKAPKTRGEKLKISDTKARKQTTAPPKTQKIPRRSVPLPTASAPPNIVSEPAPPKKKVASGKRIPQRRTKRRRKRRPSSKSKNKKIQPIPLNEANFKQIPLAKARNVDAGKLRVQLPPQGSVIHTESLTIRGQTHPNNKVSINNKIAQVKPDGSFQISISLKHGQQKLKIRTQDKQGNRGEIVWPIRVNLNRFFMMALAELTVGTQNTPLEGLDSIASFEDSGFLVHGRAAFYLKGKVQGKHILKALFKKISYTAYVETPRRTEEQAFF